MKVLKTIFEIKNYNDLKQRVSIFTKTMTKRTEYHENIYIQDEFHVQRQNKIKRMPGECTFDSAVNLSSDKKYQINVFRRIYDVTGMDMNE